MGKLTPLTEYPDPLQAAEETVTSAFEADNVPVNDELLPTVTFPKLRVVGATAKAPVVGGGGCTLEPAETPAQPASTNMPTSVRRVQRRRNRELLVLSIAQLSIVGGDRSRVPRAMTSGPN